MGLAKCPDSLLMWDGPIFLPLLELLLFVTKAVPVTDLTQHLEMTKQSDIWLFPEGILVPWTFSSEFLNLHFCALSCVRLVFILPLSPRRSQLRAGVSLSGVGVSTGMCGAALAPKGFAGRRWVCHGGSSPGNSSNRRPEMMPCHSQ